MNFVGLLLGVLTALSLLAAGCQPASPDQINRAKQQMDNAHQPKVEVTTTSLAGSWTSACARDLKRDEYYSLNTLNFNVDYLEWTTVYFRDAGCLMKSYLISSRGYFKLSGGNIISDFSGFTLQPQSDVIVSLLNTNQTCGVKDWKYGISRDFGVPGVCGYDSSLEAKIVQYGQQDELYLGELRFVPSRKNVEQDQ